MTNEQLTQIYNEANGITVKNPSLTTERIFAAMRACYELGQKSKQLLSESEQKAMLKNPYAIAELMNYYDWIYSEGDCFGYPVGEWPPARWTELKGVGKFVIEEDPDCFDETIKRRFLS